MAALEHVVVLMLENRSFDSMLGFLYPGREGFDGLKGHEANPWHRGRRTISIPVWNDAGIGRADVRGPNPDPGELFADFKAQFWGPARTGIAGHGEGEPDMSGFIDNYMRQPPGFDGSLPDPRAVMHCLKPAQVPILSLLARNFAVSDRWFASAPCQTWPNRFFVHTGTAGGWINNRPQHWPYRLPSLYRRMTQKGVRWAVYFHDIPQAALLADIMSKLPTKNFRLFHKQFEDDARAGRLPAYSFIEPRYFVSRFRDKVPNDQHPPSYMVHGEELIARIYNALRQGPNWHRTLFIVAYDEHGGLYDHVPPPAAVPPGPPYPDGFTFNRYGARVPAVLISPRIAAGTIARPNDPTVDPATPFDHTSIIRTVQELFALGPPLTARVAAAPSLLPLLADEPCNDGPPRIDFVPVAPRRQEVKRLRRFDRCDGVQLSLTSAAAFILGSIARLSAHTRYHITRAAHPLRRRRAGAPPSR